MGRLLRGLAAGALWVLGLVLAVVVVPVWLVARWWKAPRIPAGADTRGDGNVLEILPNGDVRVRWATADEERWLYEAALSEAGQFPVLSHWQGWFFRGEKPPWRRRPRR